MTDEHIIRRLDELATRMDSVEQVVTAIAHDRKDKGASEIARHRSDLPDDICRCACPDLAACVAAGCCRAEANPARIVICGDEIRPGNPIAAVAIAAAVGLTGWALWGLLT